MYDACTSRDDCMIDGYVVRIVTQQLHYVDMINAGPGVQKSGAYPVERVVSRFTRLRSHRNKRELQHVLFMFFLMFFSPGLKSVYI